MHSRKRMRLKPAMVYQIRVDGQLDSSWMEWFAPLVICQEPNGQTTLTGAVRDQAELHGVLNKVRDLNLTLLVVHTLEAETMAS